MATSDDGPTIPIDRFPEPVVRFTVNDAGIKITGFNKPFDEQFGPLSVGDTLGSQLGEFSVVQGGDRVELDVALTVAQRVKLMREASEESCLTAQVIPPLEQAHGFLIGVAGNSTNSNDTVPVDRVASVISHDLRNPLEVARTRLHAGRTTGDDSHFDHVAWAHDRMERIIEDVLTLARAEEFVKPTDRIDLDSIVTEAWESVETEGASLVVADDLPVLLIDPDRITRLFENLFRNAVEHASDPTIRVGSLAQEAGFYVEDDGAGIRPEDRERVFEPGYSSQNHGTGLGLSIVARIVDIHDWDIRTTDSNYGGARFEIMTETA